MVEIANATSTGVARPIQFFHMPVPKGRTDDAYFAPLDNLRLHPETELYLGLIHHDDPDGELRGSLPPGDIPGLAALRPSAAWRAATRRGSITARRPCPRSTGQSGTAPAKEAFWMLMPNRNPRLRAGSDP